MSKVPTPPMEWSVKNGAFVGYTLVRRDENEDISAGRARITRKVDDWMPWSVDLRCVTEMKQYEFDNPECTSLYHCGTFMCCVNAPFPELVREWLLWRHVNDQHAPFRLPGDDTPPMVIGQRPYST